MARTYFSHMLAKQTIPKQGPIPLALALISAPTTPKVIADILRTMQHQLVQVVAQLQPGAVSITIGPKF